MGKILSIRDLRHERERAGKQGQCFVFTNGCFDLLHRGHIELLKKAKSMGDLLAVALNSDASVRRIKGERRPIVKQADRCEIMAALEPVDFVTVFDEDTPERIITVLRPDILVKGSDYDMDEIVGRTQVEEMGGKVVRIQLHGDFSTESLLREIAVRYKDLAMDV
jgi:D-beta-D-heptose 7-phosphate kinase/D-beta-D-heptose 1-phosphate adenosyltransferase